MGPTGQDTHTIVRVKVGSTMSRLPAPQDHQHWPTKGGRQVQLLQATNASKNLAKCQDNPRFDLTVMVMVTVVVADRVRVRV